MNDVKKSVPLLFIIFVTIILIFMVDTYDNKYTSKNTNEQVLVNNWELYPDAIYTPKQLQEGNFPYIKTWIGEYGDLSAFHADASPYGSLTLRSMVSYHGKEKTLTLYLQEPFSATRVYINGELIAELGSIEPYESKTGTIAVSFPVKDKNEIVIQCRNEIHYVSGVYYPPIIASTNQLTRLLNERIIFYGFLCFSSLTLSLYCFVLWFVRKGNRIARLSRYLGMMTLAFALHVCYPFISLHGISNIPLWYAIEDVSGMMVVWAMISGVLVLCDMDKHKIGIRIRALLLTACLFYILIPWFVLPLMENLAIAYGKSLSYMKLIAALLCVGFSGYGLYQKKPCAFILYGSIANAILMICEIFLLNRFEPIRFGWLNEYGTFGMILCFAFLMVQNNHRLIVEHEQLTQHLREEVDAQVEQINMMQRERNKMLGELLHDLKAPLSISSLYVQLLSDPMEIEDVEMGKQLGVLNQKIEEMKQKIISMQKINQEQAIEEYKIMDLDKLLHNFYHQHKEEAGGRVFRIVSEHTPIYCMVDEQGIYRMMENLFYNALAYTKENDRITISLKCENAMTVILFMDTGPGVASEKLPYIFDTHYTSNTDTHEGLGLSIVKRIVQQHHGTITAKNRKKRGLCFRIQLPLLEE